MRGTEKDPNTKKKLTFGERMRLLKEQRKKAWEDKQLLERFPSQPSLEAKIQEYYVMPMSVTAPVERRVDITEPMSPLERAVAKLREQASQMPGA